MNYTMDSNGPLGLIVQQYEADLEHAKKRQGECPTDRPNRFHELVNYTKSITSRPTTDPSSLESQTLVVPPSYLPSVAPINSLTPITIRELRLETHHRERCLLLQGATPATRTGSVMILVKDTEGEYVRLWLHQQEQEDKYPLTEVMPSGTFFLLKEPYFVVSADEHYCVRVDHLSDIIVSPDNHLLNQLGWNLPMVDSDQTVADLKKLGNMAYELVEYHEAIKHYTNALGRSPTSNEAIILKRNRALNYLKVGRFDQALADLGSPALVAAAEDSTIIRTGQVLYALERYAEYRDSMQQLCDRTPNNKGYAAALIRAQARCHEADTGEYAFMRMQQQAKSTRPPYLDHASFFRLVEIRMSPGKGLGLFVTKDVKAGDLILAEKAFACGYVDSDAGTGQAARQKTWLVALDTKRVDVGGHVDCIVNVAQKIHKNASLGPVIKGLYHGNYESVNVDLVDDIPIVDSFLIHKVVCYNAFHCSPSNLSVHRSVIDSRKEHEREHQASTGLWPRVASYINHSCNSNACRSFIGDMMFVRASRDLEAGEEITFRYVAPTEHDLAALEKALRRIWEFACTCAICTNNKSLGPTRLRARKEFWEEFMNPCLKSKDLSSQSKQDRLEGLVRDWNKTYKPPAHKVPRLGVWHAQLDLARGYAAMSGMAEKQLASAAAALTSLGFILIGARPPPAASKSTSSSTTTKTAFAVKRWGLATDSNVEMFIHISDAFLKLAKNSTRGVDWKNAVACAKTAYRMVVGEDETFEETYGDTGTVQMMMNMSVARSLVKLVVSI